MSLPALAGVHGMGQAVALRDWPGLTARALAPVFSAYPQLGAVRGVAWHSPRPFAASGLVACDGGDVFVKRHDPRVRNVADLAEEHAFIAHLRAHGARAPLVLLARDGASAVAEAGGVYEIHAVADGDDAYRDAPSWTPMRSRADARAAGEALARLHVAASGYTAPPRRTRLVVAGDQVIGSADPLSALTRWVAGDNDLRAALAGRDWEDDFARALLPWHAALAPFLPVVAPCWVHGDFHASNLLWRDGEVSCVLDFGLSNRASAAYDLATAIERNAISWLRLSATDTAIGHDDLAVALVEGYARAAPAPPGFRQILPLVHVEFALSELAYFHGITRSAPNADLAYDTFLLGHAAWFGTGDGQRFLDALR